MLTDSMEKNNTAVYKGCFALAIVLHHLASAFRGVIPENRNLLLYIAFPLVGAFLFFSGYGLTCGLLGRPDYLKGFLQKRLLRILSPFVIAAGIATAVFSLTLHRFYNAFSPRVVVQYWFIYVILGSYFLFYLVFRFARVKTGAAVILFAAVAYIAVCMLLLSHREEMFSSVIAFPFGIYYRLYEKKIDRFLFGKRAWLKLLTVLLSFFVLFSARLFLSWRGYKNLLMHTVLRNVIVLLFALCIICTVKRVRLKAKPLLLLGGCSYEIYIIHPLIITAGTLLFSPLNIKNCSLITVTTLVISVAAAYLLNKALHLLRLDGNKHGKKT